MAVLGAATFVERLNREERDYRLRLEAETSLEKYPAKQHARRVQEKLGVEEGLIYLPGQHAKNNEDSDMPAPFRQLRYFYYLSGCNEPNCHVVYDVQHDTLALFIPRIDENRVIWNGRGSTLAEAMVKYDIDEVYYSDEVSDYIVDWYHQSRNKGNLYTLHSATKSVLDHRHGPIDTVSLRPAMNVARMIKDEHEIQLIRKANNVSSKAHRAVLASILKFKNEAQVEGLFLDICVSHQAKQQAYDPIAASGPNAGTLHYDANNEDFENRQLMCLDAGCEYELYASDITRTFPLSHSWPSKEAANIYKLVERMQEACIERLAPGVRYLDLHILAHQIAIDGLLALGILHNGTKEEIYKAGTSRAFFPHGLGHHIGLEVHDVGQAELMSVRRGKHVLEQSPSLYPFNFHLPVYNPKTCFAPVDSQSSHLEEGMVVTVEPGIYFSPYALRHFYLPSPIHSKYINLEALKRYLPVGGVRIEDDILITSSGYENLTTAPKGDAMLEIIRQGRSDSNSLPVRTQSGHMQSDKDELALLRAPGISSAKPQSIFRPAVRAATIPTELDQHRCFDFEPFQGPSLFSNFKRSMTTDEKIHRWQLDHQSALASQDQPSASYGSTTVCGGNEKGVEHVYMTSGSHPTSTCSNALPEHYLSACKQCTILCETLERLRHNLSLSGQSSPRSEGKADVMRKSPAEKYRDHPIVASLAMPQPKQQSANCGVRERREDRTMILLAGNASAMGMGDKRLQREAIESRLDSKAPVSGHPDKSSHLPNMELISQLSRYESGLAESDEQNRQELKHQSIKEQGYDKTRPTSPLPYNIVSKTRSCVQGNQTMDHSQAKTTLENFRLQQQNKTTSESERCRLGTEQGKLCLSSVPFGGTRRET